MPCTVLDILKIKEKYEIIMWAIEGKNSYNKIFLIKRFLMNYLKHAFYFYFLYLVDLFIKAS